MAATSSLLSSSPLLANNVWPSSKANTIKAPSSVSFPLRPRRLRVVKAMGGDEQGNQDSSSVDVHVSQQGNQGTAVERKPRRQLATDISPFGKFPINSVDLNMVILKKKFIPYLIH